MGFNYRFANSRLRNTYYYLTKKLHADGIEMHEDVTRFIATNIKTNVRELEGVLTSILAQATLNRQDITLDLS
jgi:chromosomal replication initiator protein